MRRLLRLWVAWAAAAKSHIDVWTPADDPLPPPWQPSTSSMHKCQWFPDRSLNASLCLMGNDRVSRGWKEGIGIRHCMSLVSSWNAIGGGDKIYLDVGGNIGHCIATMLVLTSARIVAVEPSQANLFYLTATLYALAQRDPTIKSRVKVLPLAASNVTGSDILYVASYNAGNSVVGTSSNAVRDHSQQDLTSEHYTISTRPLDNFQKMILHPDSAQAPLTVFAKIDVQGFECRALDGMQKLFRHVQVLRIELADRWLKAQGCSSTELLGKLRELGFLVDLASPPHCIFSNYGCDVTVSKPDTTSGSPSCSWRQLREGVECISRGGRGPKRG